MTLPARSGAQTHRGLLLSIPVSSSLPSPLDSVRAVSWLHEIFVFCQFWKDPENVLQFGDPKHVFFIYTDVQIWGAFVCIHFVENLKLLHGSSQESAKTSFKRIHTLDGHWVDLRQKVLYFTKRWRRNKLVAESKTWLNAIYPCETLIRTFNKNWATAVTRSFPWLWMLLQERKNMDSFSTSALTVRTTF